MAVYRCKSPFSTRVAGVPRVVSAGELVSDNDPVYKGREHLFEAVQTYVDRTAEPRPSRASRVEQATAAPGEKRSLSDTPRKGRPPGSKNKPKTEVEPAQDTEEEPSK